MKFLTSIFRRKQRLQGGRKRPGRSLPMSFAPLESRALLTMIGPVALPAVSATIASFAGIPPSLSTSLAIASTTVADLSNSGSGGAVSGTVAAFTGTAQLTPAGLSIASTSMANFSNSGSGGSVSGTATTFTNTNTSQPPTLRITSSSLLQFGDPSADGGDWNRPDEDPGAQSPQGGQAPGTSGQPTLYRLTNHVALSEATVTVNGIATPEFALADAGKSEVRVRIGNEVQILGPGDGIDRPQSVELAYLNGDPDTDAVNPYPDLVVANSGGNNVLVFPGLPGGRFGPAMNGIQGFAVGQDPVSVTVADVNDDGVPDLLVANQKSDTVSILQGEETVASWNSSQVQTIAVGDDSTNTAPIKVLYKDANDDGQGDLFVCNSGSNNIYLYTGLGNGTFNTTDPKVFDVGLDPNDMVFGQFDRRPQLDLVTVNAGSDNLTLIDGVLTSNPTMQTISSGGIMPDAAYAFPTQNGMMDLMVANSGDGRLALLQAGNSGLQIAGIFSLTNLPDPTSLAIGSSDGNGIDLIAATAGQDAAELLRFDLGVSSTFLPTPLSGSNGTSESDGDLIAGLMPFGDSSLELVAVFWVGNSDQSALFDESGLHEPSTITALYSPTEGQGNGTTTTAEVMGDPQATPAVPDKAEPSFWTRYVTGVDLKLESTGDPIDAVATADIVLIDPDRSREQFAWLDPSLRDTSFSPDEESIQGTIDAVVRAKILEGRSISKEENAPIDPPARIDPPRPQDGVDAPGLQGRFETVPLVSSVVLLSTRLILKSSPPRPPGFRKGRHYRVAAGKPETGPGT